MLLAGVVVLAGALVHWQPGSAGGSTECSGPLAPLAAAVYAAASVRCRRWIYLGWLYAVFPIGWTVSHVLLAATYYLVVTPDRAADATGQRRDPLERTLDRAASSYWTERRPVRDVRRYFRQF